MIIKARKVPLIILILLALLRRLPKNHDKRSQIMKELARRQAGYQGEESLDYYLCRLPEKDYMIFHDLNLPFGKYNCQNDTILLTPKLALILETKNMTGTLKFDLENEQFFQTIDGNDKGYTDPIAQAEMHKACIQEFLLKYNFPPVPVDYLVVISNPYAVISYNGNHSEVKKRVCKSHNLLKKIDMFEKMYTNEFLTEKELRKLCKLLVKKNTPPTIHVLERCGIKRSELRTGPHCPSCDYLPIVRKKRKWYCPSCNTFANDALDRALLDYFLLFDSKITNHEFRAFAHITSVDAAGRHLRSAGLTSSGEKKNRSYSPDTIPW
ncbi:NERD domain-containing protein [Neobacillus sp. MM2021_6]|uniref:nuclease-related domain-containing protein n=1 Tax=Bacillaceae TaxID=186817 RepID=UPI00140E736F|nr:MULTISPECIES: nuclease-related domain-containing protein [Bacillaceae]MBO0961361.1 NERD domain-containing protein [Neobacillus sp. MM2021_6]NHC20529.1 NERD domain-containing protein [Bacillus sp. MM2020_4]